MTEENFFDIILLETGGKIKLIKLDYSLSSPAERNELVKKILKENPDPGEKYLEILADYLIFAMEKKEKKEKKILTDNKQIIFQPKITITKKDLEEIAPLRELRQAINIWETKLKTAEGKDRFIIKKALIEMRKDQYIIKNSYR